MHSGASIDHGRLKIDSKNFRSLSRFCFDKRCLWLPLPSNKPDRIKFDLMNIRWTSSKRTHNLISIISFSSFDQTTHSSIASSCSSPSSSPIRWTRWLASAHRGRCTSSRWFRSCSCYWSACSASLRGRHWKWHSPSSLLCWFRFESLAWPGYSARRILTFWIRTSIRWIRLFACPDRAPARSHEKLMSCIEFAASGRVIGRFRSS